MKEIVDKCSTNGCSVDTGTVIDKRRRDYPLWYQKKTEEKVLPEATFTFSCQAGLIILNYH